ncbi:fimbria/pilus periplasmic chaperone [Salmonella enterica]|nr:fimbria/pilus periplasmic chaperone [Salmonella enterica]
MKNQFLVVIFFIFSGLIISPAVMAERNSVPHSDGVGTGATRVVYPSGSKHVTLSVNNTADHPFLVESVVLDESMRQESVSSCFSALRLYTAIRWIWRTKSPGQLKERRSRPVIQHTSI